MGVAGRSRRRHRIEDHRRTTEKAPGPCRRDAEKDSTLMEEAQSGRAQPQEIMPKMMAIRMEYSGKLETVLTDAQKKQWQSLLGKPFDLGMRPGGPPGPRPEAARPAGPADPSRFHVKPGFTIERLSKQLLAIASSEHR